MTKPKPQKRTRKWWEWVTLVIAAITWPWTVTERVRRRIYGRNARYWLH
ncbi:MAG: hypothetical protein AAF572_27425 [Cyanobacteria bacterium P01_B01_bin.77]